MNTRLFTEQQMLDAVEFGYKYHKEAKYYIQRPEIAAKEYVASISTQGTVKSAEEWLRNEKDITKVTAYTDRKTYYIDSLAVLMEEYAASQLQPNNEAMAPQSQGVGEVIQKRIEEVRESNRKIDIINDLDLYSDNCTRLNELNTLLTTLTPQSGEAMEVLKTLIEITDTDMKGRSLQERATLDSIMEKTLSRARQLLSSPTSENKGK